MIDDWGWWLKSGLVKGWIMWHFQYFTLFWASLWVDNAFLLFYTTQVCGWQNSSKRPCSSYLLIYRKVQIIFMSHPSRSLMMLSLRSETYCKMIGEQQIIMKRQLCTLTCPITCFTSLWWRLKCVTMQNPGGGGGWSTTSSNFLSNILTPDERSLGDIID